MSGINKGIGILIVLLCVGCAGPDYYTKKEQSKGFDKIVLDQAPVKIIEIKNYVSVVDELDNLKSADEKIDIQMTEGLQLEDLIGLLKDKGVNIVVRSSRDKEKKEVSILPLYKGTIKGLLRAVQEAIGVFYRVNDGTLTILDSSQVYIKVIYSGQVSQIEGVLKAFGVHTFKYDTILNRVVFQSDYETFRKVRDYFANAPLTVAGINIVVIESSVSKNSSIGIDWSQLSLLLDQTARATSILKVVGGQEGAFGVSAARGTVSLTGILSSLETFKKFDVVQNCNLSVANGESGSIEVSQKYPYVSAISLSSLSTTSQGTVQSTTFDTADAGLTITVVPIIDEKVLSVNVQMKYQSIIEYITVGTKDQQVTRPVVSTRNIKTVASLMAGEVISIGSLRYKESSEQSSGIFKMNKIGLSSDDEKWLELNALMGVNLTRYILK